MFVARNWAKRPTQLRGRLRPVLASALSAFLFETPSPRLYLGCRPQRSTATARQYRPCRSSQPLHSLPNKGEETELRGDARFRLSPEGEAGAKRRVRASF